MTRQAAVRLPDEVFQRLQYLAEKTGRTATWYMREAIQTHLDDLEDYYLASQVLSDIKKGAEKVYSQEEVRKEIGLED